MHHNRGETTHCIKLINLCTVGKLVSDQAMLCRSSTCRQQYLARPLRPALRVVESCQLQLASGNPAASRAQHPRPPHRRGPAAIAAAPSTNYSLTVMSSVPWLWVAAYASFLTFLCQGYHTRHLESRLNRLSDPRSLHGELLDSRRELRHEQLAATAKLQTKQSELEAKLYRSAH